MKEDTGVSAVKCYQCGKCSAGCPVSDEMDFPPSVIMRMLQKDEKFFDEKVLKSYTIWVCLTCEMCYARCPMEIDIPKAMDYLRQKSLTENKVNKKAYRILAFHKSFLGSIKSVGRLHEVGLIISYKMKTFNLFQDVLNAPKLFSRGKLHILPERINGRKNLSKIFSKTIGKS